ncbi:MAG TPA: hypothetical protein VMN57_13145 [Anaerolineales bacterium]|nr:hypothetical protein [Anaerolineales bacterium]
MNKAKILITGLGCIVALVIAGCDPTPTPSTASCPPLGTGATASVGGSDGSSIEVYIDTYGDTPSSPWCDTTQLSITSVVPPPPPPCPQAGCLAAVDVKPDDISFTNSANSQASTPTLTFDLNEHPPEDTSIDLEDCSGSFGCFSFYRHNGSSWVFAGMAETKLVGTEWFAIGRVNHFSIFALVGMPTPTPVPPPRLFGLVIQSPFFMNDDGGLSVAVLVAEDDRQEYSIDSGEKILTFTGVEPLIAAGEALPECAEVQRVEAQFTCLFPTGSRTELELGEEVSSWTALRSGARMEFTVQDVIIQ